MTTIPAPSSSSIETTSSTTTRHPRSLLSPTSNPGQSQRLLSNLTSATIRPASSTSHFHWLEHPVFFGRGVSASPYQQGVLL
ncbi:hypothetical protein BDN72DRAFT_840454, partial [Pluteus cervinus]